MKENKKFNVAFLSTYPPMECGIATFTQDIINELKKIKIVKPPKVIAVKDRNYEFPNDVIYEIDKECKSDYLKLASRLNNSNIDLLVIEHEYGIYGGNDGEYILELTENLKVPYVVTFHTILSKPSEKQKFILNRLSSKSIRIITMAKNTIPLLNNMYGTDEKKINVIPHGVPNITTLSKANLRNKYRLSDRKIVSTFGLLSPGKGLEYGIEAIAKIKDIFPEILYLIIGETHPNIKETNGEEYRNKLKELIKKLGVEDNVKFLNRYLSKKEIVEYLKLSDIYLTPYLSREQAVSGTLAYAAGLGKLIISTPYKYAEEVLGDGRGLLAEFRDASSIANLMRYAFKNPDKVKIMEEKIKLYGESMIWNNVALDYVKLFISLIEEERSSDENAV